jgi:hypothetical protein
MSRKQLFDPSSNAPFAMSRSKLDLFVECPCCFYLDRRLGIARPSGFPFTLNMAVDTLLKKEFDQYRKAQKTHPLMKAHGIDAVPFQHPDLDTWRNNFKGISFHHVGSHIVLSGAMDDIWMKPNNELIVADYKATSTTDEISMDSGYKDVFKRQLEVYQWILRQNDFKVDKTAYLVYANAQKTPAAFDAKLDFEMTLLSHPGDTSWIEPALLDARRCLEAARPPAPKKVLNKKGEELYDCEYCGYAAERKAVL